MSKSSCKIRKEGPLFLQSGLLIKKWKRYNFVLNQANFQYFKLHEVNETKGQIVVSDILRTEELHNFDTQRASFPFAVHFSGHGSPWILDANTEEERKRWVEALQFIIQWPMNKTPDLSRVKSQLECRGISNDAPYQHQRRHHGVLLQQYPSLQIDSLQCQCSSKFNDIGSPKPASMELNLDFYKIGTHTSSEDYRDTQMQQKSESITASCAHGSSPFSIAGSEYEEMKKELDSESEYEKMQQAEKPSSFDLTVPASFVHGSTPFSIAEYEEIGKQLDSKSEYEIMQPAEKQSSFDFAVIQLHQQKSRLKSVPCTSQIGIYFVFIWPTLNNVQESITPLEIEREAITVPSAALSEFVLIGQGQFGEVFKAIMFKGTPAEVVVTVKTIKETSSGKERDGFLKEMCFMSTIMHPNIVRLLGMVFGDDEAPSVIFEYLSHGDLKSFLSKNHRSVQKLVKYMIDVAMGMHYIAERRLTHKNLALKNVYVCENETCKIADFGLFHELPSSDVEAKTDALSFRWMAPECINSSQQFSIASDVWSYGILMWEMFNPDLIPYHTLDAMECMAKVGKGYRLSIPEKAPNILSRLMKACWNECPEKRPSFFLITTLLMTKGLEEAECEQQSTTER